MRQILLDTETTGLRHEDGHRLTEIGCLELINRKLTGRKFYTRLNPERKVDADASRITGITTEMLLNEPKFIEVADDFLDFIQDDELIIHNAPFDVAFINKELSLIKHKIVDLYSNNKILDTLVLARAMYPNQRNSLDALCKRFNVNHLARDLHGALLDAELLAHVYLALTKGQSSFFDGETKFVSNIQNTETLFVEVVRTKSLPVIKADEV